MITIKEIAGLVGTSRGTVDRVINKRGNVNPELAKRILEIARENNYRSNPHAKALVKGGQKHLIGIVINSVGNRFFDDVLLGIHEAVDAYRSYGFDVLIKEIKGYKEQEQLDALDELLRHDLAALAITPLDTPAIAQRLSSLAPLPIVTLNSDIHIAKKLAFIGCDYLNSGRLSGDLASLMLGPGGNVSIVTGSFYMLGHNERIQGFRDVLRENRTVNIVSVNENNDDNDTSYDITREILAQHHPDLIYFCAAGTEGGVRAVKESGLPVRVIVVDDIQPMRDALNEGTIQGIVTQQPYKQGATMVDTLYSYLITGTKPDHVHNYMENQVKLRHSF